MESQDPPNIKKPPQDPSDVIPFADEATPGSVPKPQSAPAAPEGPLGLFVDASEHISRPAGPPDSPGQLPAAYDSSADPFPASPEIGQSRGLPWEAPSTVAPLEPPAPLPGEPRPLPPAYDSASEPFPPAPQPVQAGDLPWESPAADQPVSVSPPGPLPALAAFEMPHEPAVVAEPPPPPRSLPQLSEFEPEPFALAEFPAETAGPSAPAPRRVFDAPIPPPAPRPVPPRPGIFDRYSLLWLLLITIAAGLFRFLWIDRPACWTDEAYTFRRLVGSFHDLLDVLQYDGFGPLLYEFNWWLAQRIGGASHMTPFWLRLLPASAGTLMVPAMYFLARQLVSKRTSLVVALFTASSAYMMAYSHDAKMYMLLWLAVALNLGGLFWWFRSNLRVAWLTWIAAGILVGGTHAPGLIVLALQPFFLLSQKEMHWRKFLAFVAGMAVLASAPLVHYTQFNRMVDKIEDEGWGASGVGWVPGVLSGRGGEEMALSAASAYMYSWEWPRFTYKDDDATNRYERNQQAAGGLMLQGFNINPRIMSGLMTAVCVVFGLCILGALPWTRRLRGARLGEEPVQPAWRLVFWLGLWVLLPAYVYYCISVFGMKGVGRNGAMPFVSPGYYWDSIVNIFSGNWWDLKPSPGGQLAPRAEIVHILVLKWTLVSAIAGLLCAGLLWSGRVFRIIAASLAGALGLMMLVFFVTALWKTGWTRPVGLPDGKTGKEWLESWRAVRLVGSAFYDAATGQWMTWGVAFVLPAVALQLCADTVVGRLKKALQLAAALAALFGAIWLAHYFVSQELAHKTPQELGPIWMPRYLGAIWPAFAIVICALLMRLPTRILRVVAVCLLLGVNVAQACGRMFAGTEPPVDKMIAEVYDSQEPGTPGGPKVRSNFRTYIERPAIVSTHPAGTWVDPGGPNPASKYYAALIRGKAFDPQVWRNIPLASYVATIWSDTTPRSIAADVKRYPYLEHITVWDRFPELPQDPKKQIDGYTRALNSAKAGIEYTYEGRKYSKSSIPELERAIAALQAKAGAPEPDPLLDLLGTGWKREPDCWFQVRYHWNWSEIYATRRREYVHTPQPAAPAVQPVVQPTIQPTTRPLPAPAVVPVPQRPGVRPATVPATPPRKSIFEP
ncbi:MAG: hypothetical protein ABSH20_14030 [Tepidisphaeraceae bacterium]|jgi:hypothetical protein